MLLVYYSPCTKASSYSQPLQDAAMAESQASKLLIFALAEAVNTTWFTVFEDEGVKQSEKRDGVEQF